jgi:hypothetical protein
MKNTTITLFLLFLTASAWSFPSQTLFVRLQAQRMGLLHSPASFHVGDTYLEGGLGIDWRENVVTTILSVDQNIVHYKSTKVGGATNVSRNEYWVNTQTGQLIKAIFDGSEKAVEDFEPIENFDQVSNVKIKTFLGEKDCVSLTIKSRLLNQTYFFCEELPGLGLLRKTATFMESGGFEVVDFTSF